MARERSARPVAVNLLLPFARAAHWLVAADADVVVTFWGRPRRRTGKAWVHQCGSVREALAAQRAGADGVIVQGVEAGLALGQAERAHRMLSLLERTGRGDSTPFLRGQATRLGARLAVAEGATEDPAFSQAEKVFRDSAMPFWLAVTLLEHAEWLGSAGRAAEAGPLLEEAGEIFERLAATPWIERVDLERDRVTSGVR
jgi:hypothetical protein